MSQNPPPNPILRPILTYLHVPLAIMSEAPLPIDPDEAVLGRLAELDLALAERVQAAAMGAETPKDMADLSRAYQRISRCVRQTLALKAQLKRQREQGTDDAPPSPRRRAPAPVRNRQHCLREAVLRVVWNEQEPLLDPTELSLEMEARLDEMAAADGFLDADLDEQIAVLCAVLDLPPELSARWSDLPRYVDEDGDEDEDAEAERAIQALIARHRRSSA